MSAPQADAEFLAAFLELCNQTGDGNLPPHAPLHVALGIVAFMAWATDRPHNGEMRVWMDEAGVRLEWPLDPSKAWR